MTFMYFSFLKKSLKKYNYRCSFLDLPVLKIMFNLDKVHMILDEMIMNGQIVETNKNRILAPVAVLDKAAK